MNQALIVTAALTAFLALAFFCLRGNGPSIEASLQNDATEQLQQAGLAWASVRADGRILNLRGIAPADAERQLAAQLVGEVRGVRTVINEIQLPDEQFSPVAETPAYETRMVVSPGFVRYSGFVPDSESRIKIVNRTRELFSGRRVEDEMTIRDGAPSNWLEAMLAMQQRFATYARAEAVISDNRLNVFGSVPADSIAERKLLAARLPGNFKTEISLSIAPVESAEDCQRTLDRLMQRKINFQVASAIIDTASYELLDQLAERIRGCGGLRIEVSGHTDSQGLAMKNLELSQRRAEAVVDYLIAAGIDADQLVAWGYGESRPVADNETELGRAENRRIEFQAMN